MGDCRRVGVAVDFSPCSRKALEWAVNNIVRKGDHLILVTVQHEGHYEEGEMQLWEATGSRKNSSFFISIYDGFIRCFLLAHQFFTNMYFLMGDFTPINFIGVQLIYACIF